ncbi:MAG: DUF445 family protein [Proteobacteria bacterium]|nr:DUF445 family protein [Pseudomonadota bacterium]MBU1639392.1 DUF445 family protein [Pseudomonadota bacterium]
MPSPLVYLAPPALGAFIGYMTNYVAIKMLFRPLKPWKILGMRVPMTPGVIPSKRHDLAVNIGEMVGSHLLTSGDIGKAISSPSFQGELATLINSRLDDVLQKDLGPITEIIPQRFNSYFLATVKVLRWRFIDQLHQYLEGDEFSSTISATLRDRMDALLKSSLSQAFPESNREHLYAFLEQTATKILSHPRLEEWLRDLINTKIDDFIKTGKAPADLIPDDIIDYICSRLQQEAPAILSKLAGVVQEPVLQQRIASSICEAIGSFTASLGPLAAMVSGFLSPELIQNKVCTFLTDKGDEIGQWLANDALQDRVSLILTDKVREFLATPFSQFLAGVSEEKKDQLREDLLTQLVALLHHPKTAESLTALLKEALASQDERTIEEMLLEIFGTDGLENSKEWLADKVISTMRSARVKKLIDTLIIEHVEKKLLGHPIGKLTDILSPEVLESIGEYARGQISDLLIREVPGLVDLLNIKELVTRKVDGLDLMRLENLLMSIMEEQFKYINLFGALLGFIIGMLNLLVMGL